MGKGRGKASGQKKQKGAPPRKNKGGNDKPSRDRYWSSGRLQERKIKALMRHSGMTRAEAYLHWKEARKGRMR